MSRDLTAGVETETTALQVKPVLLMKGEFDGGDVNLWTGYGEKTWNGDIYTGAGHLLGVSGVEEALGVEARGMQFTLTGIDSALLSAALTENYQGRPVTVWMGFLNSSDAIITDPFIIFRGRMDVIQIDENGQSATIGLRAENRLIDLKRVKVRRYTPEDQKAEYSGDLGCDYVASLQETELAWGKK